MPSVIDEKPRVAVALIIVQKVIDGLAELFSFKVVPNLHSVKVVLEAPLQCSELERNVVQGSPAAILVLKIADKKRVTVPQRIVCSLRHLAVGPIVE
jgi:hypothetical protein